VQRCVAPHSGIGWHRQLGCGVRCVADIQAASRASRVCRVPMALLQHQAYKGGAPRASNNVLTQEAWLGNIACC